MARKPSITGREKRAPGDSQPVFMRVDPETYRRMNAAAQALGMTLAKYQDLLVQRDEVDAEGVPLWVRERQKEAQLPLPHSA